jgi:diguanylate cyclase (GGDEF)-like protein
MSHKKTMMKKRVLKLLLDFSSLKIKFLLFIFVLITGPTYASNQYDEMLKRADNIKNADPIQFVDLLDHLNAESSLLTTNQQLELKYLNAHRLSYSGKLNEALGTYLELAENKDSKNIKIKALSAIVNTYTFTNRWLEGLKQINKLLALLDNSDDDSTLKEAINKSYFVLAQFFNHLGEYDLAILNSKILLNNSPNEKNLCLGKMVQIEALINLEKLHEDDITFDIAEQLCEKAHEPIATNLIKIFKATALLSENKYEQVIQLLNNSLDETNATKYSPLIAKHNSLLADAYLRKKNYKLARQYAEQLVNSKNTQEYKPSVVSAYKTLYQVADIEQDYNAAFDYLKKYNSANNAFLDDVKIKALAYQQAKYETRERENKITLLDKENALLKIQSELANKNAENDRLIMALLSLVLILVFFWTYKNRRVHKKLRQLAETDELTGIANRYYFTQLANAAIGYSQKSRQPMSFILFDLDFFKKINDNFGHQVGDWALKQVVIEVAAVCRNNDVIGRLGGEEFGILLPGCTVDKATALAESCRLAIAAINPTESGHAFNVTASFGVADAQSCGYQFDKLFAAADGALYKSKDMGRNKVYTYQHEQLSLDIH